MICPIVTSPVLLQIPSTNATQADRSVGENLKETLQAHAHECVGMAANMIGVHKRIIVVAGQNATKKTNEKILSKQKGHTLPEPILMYNPEITKFSKPYETKEGCLSLQVFVAPRATNKSLCATSMNNSTNVPNNSVVLLHKSFNMKSTIVMAF